MYIRLLSIPDPFIGSFQSSEITGSSSDVSSVLLSPRESIEENRLEIMCVLIDVFLGDSGVSIGVTVEESVALISEADGR